MPARTVSVRFFLFHFTCTVQKFLPRRPARPCVKEIGIRKVFGVSVANVMLLLSKEPVKLIVMAFMIASPIAYWVMNQWLENYQYKVDMGWWVFALTGSGILLLALAIISIQTIRSALTNPVNSLKHE